MQKGANFCTTLLLLYHTSDWLSQQNIPVGNIGKLEAFIVFVYDCCDWLKCFHTKETTFQNILFHKPAVHRLINSSSENTTVSMWRKLIAAEQ